MVGYGRIVYYDFNTKTGNGFSSYVQKLFRKSLVYYKEKTRNKHN